MAGTLPFVLACVLWNLAGLIISLYLGAFPLFFDMTGTAVASLSRGLGYGVFVALLSNLIPAVLFRLFGIAPLGLDPETYLWFGFTNAVGAIVWASAPRVVVYLQRNCTAPKGFLSTDPTVGYRVLMQQIVLVGIVVGGAATVAACFTQYVALDCRPGDDMGACNESSPAVSAAKAFTLFLGLSEGAVGSVYYVVLLLFNIPDKIVATAAAMMLVFTFHPAPDYLSQREKLREFERRSRTSPKSFLVAWIAYLLTCGLFSVAYFWILFSRWPVSIGTMFVYVVFVLILLIFLLPLRGLPLHSVFYQKETANDGLYHDRSKVARQSVHRDVFEDLLKTAVVCVMLLNLLLTRVQQSIARAGLAQAGTNTVEPNAERVVGGASETSQLIIDLAGPILLLTLWRYFIVFLARYRGALYARQAPP